MAGEMTADDVVAFLRQMRGLGIDLWIDGGWGVDALLGEQTRRHADLDIVIEERDCATAVAFLKARGFREVPRDDSRPCNFVLGNAAGKEIDFHVIVLDDSGDGLYGSEGAWEGAYPAAALRGEGTIGGLEVRCTSPAYQVQSHRGYAFGPTDIKDVTALAERFGLALPEEYLGIGDCLEESSGRSSAIRDRT